MSVQAEAVIGRDEDRSLPAGVVCELDLRRAALATLLGAPLRCVSSGYLSGGCSCQACDSRGIVTAAWRQELGAAAGSCDRFFRFAWRGGEWLAFGLRDGRDPGVYCPDHSAERDERQHRARSLRVPGRRTRCPAPERRRGRDRRPR